MAQPLPFPTPGGMPAIESGMRFGAPNVLGNYPDIETWPFITSLTGKLLEPIIDGQPPKYIDMTAQTITLGDEQATGYDPARLPSYESFLAGTPERVVTTAKPKVALTWLHTNENHAPAAAHELYANHPDIARYVNYICGDPLTARHAKENGFADRDLNRAFLEDVLANPTTYTERRAVEVMDFVEDAEYVLDAHNTVCTNFGKIIILKENYLDAPAIRQIIAASPIKRIMVMAPGVIDGSLIDEPNAKTVTLEYEMGLTETEAVPDTIATIRALVTGDLPESSEREIFRVVGKIPKSKDPGLHVKNFEPFTGEDGEVRYAAFLGTGKRSYREDTTKDYCGFYVTREVMVL